MSTKHTTSLKISRSDQSSGHRRSWKHKLRSPRRKKTKKKKSLSEADVDQVVDGVWGSSPLSYNLAKFGQATDFLNACISYVETVPGAIIAEGIFRRSGNEKRIIEIKKGVNTEDCYHFSEEEHVHNVATAMKRFLREMEVPLIPFTKYENFIAAERMTDSEEKESTMIRLISTLPKYNLQMTSLIINFLYKVSQYASENLMHERNLAIVFGPNLVRPEVETPMTLISDNGLITSMIASWIEAPDKYFNTSTPILSSEQAETEILDKLRRGYQKHRRKSFRTLNKMKLQRSMDDEHFEDKIGKMAELLMDGMYHLIIVDREL
eukprot:TRINITY_DN1949_c0_g1_i2.p1 TRINITY_DN1949_c0_g1~~TRINITY_DN1949_c0_g1_i2.p1  ORF type:complete len:322 (-),score=56.71 TRINITY_DN1949_c0_g1_i2:174-1139(-)